MSFLAPSSRPAAEPSFAYSDVRALQRIGSDEAGIRAAAKQFESLFIGMMLKGMREANAVLAEGSMLSSPELTMHQEMLDQQWAIHMAESGGIGLAPVIEAELKGERVPLPSAGFSDRANARPGTGAVGSDGEAVAGAPAAAGQAAPVTASRLGFKAAGFPSREAFVTQLLPVVRRATAGLELDPSHVLAQSALETGWGRHVIHIADGTSSHNLFGIKAGADWTGPSVAVKTLEVVNGRPEVQEARFRSYPDLHSAVADYVRFLQNDGRYGEVLKAGDADGFARALQGSGYATDPAYGQKLRAVIASVSRLLEA